MARAAFKIADWILLAEVSQRMKQNNGSSEDLVRIDVEAALVDEEEGCRSLLRWLKDGQEIKEYPKPAFWRRPSTLLVWDQLPRRLCVRLPPDEHKGDVLHVFLHRADVVRCGLLSALELPQTKQRSKQQPQQPPKKRESASADAQPQPQPQPQSPHPSIAEVPKLSGKKWVPIAYTRGADTLRLMTITEAARALAEESKTTPDRAKPLSEGYIKNELRKLNVWEPQPRNPLNPPQQRRK
jgi:hypothetical protein